MTTSRPRDLEHLKESLLRDIEKAQNCSTPAVSTEIPVVSTALNESPDLYNATTNSLQNSEVENITVSLAELENASNAVIEILTAGKDNSSAGAAESLDNNTVLVSSTEDSVAELNKTVAFDINGTSEAVVTKEPAQTGQFINATQGSDDAAQLQVCFIENS